MMEVVKEAPCLGGLCLEFVNQEEVTITYCVGQSAIHPAKNPMHHECDSQSTDHRYLEQATHIDCVILSSLLSQSIVRYSSSSILVWTLVRNCSQTI